MLIMWDKRIVEKIDMFVGEFDLACSFRSVVDDFSWAFAGVYNPNIDALRSSLWDELVGLSSWWELPWCIGGDFNVTRFPAERSRDVRLNAAMMEFSDLFLSRVLWIFHLQEGRLRGLIIRRIPLGFTLIDFLYLLIWKSSFQVLCIKGFLDCVLIIFRFFLIVEAFTRVLDRSSLRMCG
jgi:hypothetical protein